MSTRETQALDIMQKALQTCVRDADTFAASSNLPDFIKDTCTVALEEARNLLSQPASSHSS